ncbi:hypothetical protein [Acinetobacter radioresistens]|uniref:hypothetical protein n=1 Tax=Acinetobacter radioresistens TaxID=40216 RepID=UPI00224719AC|nr:hypothetical protein [Acinetobacter radioresistens]MCX0338316.1 hypothetical protein [Acinetobacter radioresistens]
MSYKHNNLLAMRQSYWNDEQSVKVQHEKLFFQQVLAEYHIFTEPNLEDARYFFFTLPSIIIVKGYALGFMHESVKALIIQHLIRNKTLLNQRHSLKVQYR